MHPSTLILVAEGMAVVVILCLFRLQILLRVKADEYLVLSHVKKGKECYRVLTDGIFFRPPWQKDHGHVHRGVQILEWERGARIVVNSCDECVHCDHQHELNVVAYVVSIRFMLIDNRTTAKSIVLGELDPATHMQTCVDEAIVKPGQKPLDPQDAAVKLERRLKLDARPHGYEVIDVAAWVPGI